jgi:hypothetical protein
MYHGYVYGKLLLYSTFIYEYNVSEEYVCILIDCMVIKRTYQIRSILLQKLN